MSTEPEDPDAGLAAAIPRMTQRSATTSNLCAEIDRLLAQLPSDIDLDVWVGPFQDGDSTFELGCVDETLGGDWALHIRKDSGYAVPLRRQSHSVRQAALAHWPELRAKLRTVCDLDEDRYEQLCDILIDSRARRLKGE
jgi:hypothetical protein